MRIADAQELWSPAGVYCNTASYGLPPRPAWEALQAVLADWQVGRTSWERWGESTEASRAAFARLLGVEASRVAVGATVSELVGSVVTALPAGARVVVPDVEFTSLLFPLLVQSRLDVRTVPVAEVAGAVAEGADVVAFSAVQMSTGEVADLDATNSAAIAFERWRDPELILLRANDPAAKITPRPDEKIDGKLQTVIDLGSPFNGLDVSIYIDKTTKQITRMAYSDLDPQGHRSSEVDDFADYRDVGGVKVAFKRTTTVGPRVTVFDFAKIEIDPKIDPKVYDRPAP